MTQTCFLIGTFPKFCVGIGSREKYKALLSKSQTTLIQFLSLNSSSFSIFPSKLVIMISVLLISKLPTYSLKKNSSPKKNDNFFIIWYNFIFWFTLNLHI